MSNDFKPAGMNLPQLDLSTSRNLANSVANTIADQARDMERATQSIYRERERKEAAEVAYREETIRSLRAIEQNTANLYTLVDLISKSNEQQEELIALISEVLSIATAKTKGEAETKYRAVMDKITKTVKDVEAMNKMVGYATTVWTLAQPIIDKLPL